MRPDLGQSRGHRPVVVVVVVVVDMGIGVTR